MGGLCLHQNQDRHDKGNDEHQISIWAWDDTIHDGVTAIYGL